MTDNLLGNIFNEASGYPYDKWPKIKLAASNAKQSVLQSGREGIAALITNPTYFGITAAVEILLVWLILYKWSPFGVGEKYPALVTTIMLATGFISLMMYVLVDNKNFLKKKGVETGLPDFSDMAYKVGFTALAVLGIVFLAWGTIVVCNHPLILSWVWWFFNFFFISFQGLIITSLGYVILKPYIDAGKKQGTKNVLSLIGSLIMYIPCAFIDLIEWIKYQNSITTKTTWILLGMEALVVGLGFIVPRIISWVLNLNGKHLLRYPIYLDKETIIGKHKDLYGNQTDNSRSYEIGNVVKITNETPEKTPPKYKYKYSISGWFWINPQPPNTRPAFTKFTNIIKYGDKPAVEYNSLENILRVRCKTADEKFVTIFSTDKVDFQTWNNIVINYDGANMDIFLNGELVGSRPGIVPYMSYENVIVGADKGLEGGIANVVFRDKILHKSEIQVAYKTLKNSSPPVL